MRRDLHMVTGLREVKANVCPFASAMVYVTDLPLYLLMNTAMAARRVTVRPWLAHIFR